MSSIKIPITTNRMGHASLIAQKIVTLLCDSANIPRPKFFARAFSATRHPPKLGPKLLATLSPLAGRGSRSSAASGYPEYLNML
jgi:hypothetical protein